MELHGIWSFSLVLIIILAPEGFESPTLITNTSKSVVIRWKEPKVKNGIIVAYEIQRRMNITHPFTLVAEVQASSPYLFIDATVRPFTFYEYVLIAKTKVGGSHGPYTSIKTLEGGMFF